jgi:hypothetical protein
MSSSKEKQRERRHLERMKCLEQGVPLQDAELAWCRVVKQRGEQLTGILIVGALVLVGGPVAATAILMALGQQMEASYLVMLVGLVWLASSVTLFWLLRHGMTALMQLNRHLPGPSTASPSAASTAEVRNGRTDTRFFESTP